MIWKKVVTRARGKVNHFVNDEYYNGSEFSGFTIGRGDPLLARIYNKTLEVKKISKNFGFMICGKNIYGMK